MLYATKPRLRLRSNKLPARDLGKKVSSSKSAGSGGKVGKSKSRKRNRKNPYLKIIEKLPKEINEKLDSTKENIDDI